MIASRENMPPCNMFDANGLEWKYMRWIDTETGEGEQIVTDENGVKQINPYRTAVLTQRVQLPAPVLLVPTNPLYDTKEEWDAAMKEAEQEIQEERANANPT